MAKRGQYKRTEPVAFLDESLEAWERQRGEGDKAWEAFMLYRDAGQEGGIPKRTQREVCLRLFPGRDPTKARTSDIGEWSIKWRWRERTEAYDRHLDGIKREAFAAALQRDAELNIAAYRTMRNRGSAKLVQLAAENIAPSLAVKMVDTGITGLRREAGLATEITGSEKDDAFVAWLTAGEDEEGDK